MNKTEALQEFISHVDVPGVRASFPDLDYEVTELEDGQQEIVIRLQGVDPDFHPTADIAVIESMDRADLPTGVKNTIVLRKYQREMIMARKQRRDIALLKRIKALILPAGVSLREIAKVVRNYIPVEEVEQ